MPTRKKLLQKLFQKGIPKNFTKQELYSLMSKCGCIIGQGGRGSGIKIYHEETGRILMFDEPHPGNTLYSYQIKATRKFLIDVGEYKEGDDE